MSFSDSTGFGYAFSTAEPRRTELLVCAACYQFIFPGETTATFLPCACHGSRSEIFHKECMIKLQAEVRALTGIY